MNTTTRTKLLKTYLDPEEEKTILQACAAAGVTRSDQARQSLLHWARQQRHGSQPGSRREGPNGGPRRRSQLLPCRPSFGVIPKMHMRV
ncbi:hypothetical protein [Janthinobacterium sp. PAMC25594]|jgi:hypothetical protein|uniref:hypothetical protein n=1 Tax=Janthinobacterium sp. PAMC25594 TaxID=2861284 RepID=UPI001C638EE7|nr:hypothetical protein [Janthinobacterium sp. PAMC25594]QYG07142.1 hypothetical protein KY494_28825 [Janthinobacterium sp. PAMC25594]